MAENNIISVNVPNGVSIIIMAAVGGLAVAALKKALGGKSGPTIGLPAGAGAPGS